MSGKVLTSIFNMVDSLGYDVTSHAFKNKMFTMNIKKKNDPDDH